MAPAREVSKPLKSVANESIFGNGNSGFRPMREPSGISERDRRIILRDIERKKRLASGEMGGAYGHLSAAGANIAFTQRDCEVEGKAAPCVPAIRGAYQAHEAEGEIARPQSNVRCNALQMPDKCLPTPNAYCPHEDRPMCERESTAEHKEEDPRRKKEDYLHFLQKQMLEQQEKKKAPAIKQEFSATPLPPVPAAEGPGADFVRYKKRDVDPETAEKRERQKLYMQNELNRQIEDRNRRRIQEKQKEREEAEREEQRFRREQAELAAKHKVECGGQDGRVELRPRRSLAQNLFQPSEENSFAYVVQGTKPVLHPVASRASALQAQAQIPVPAEPKAPVVVTPVDIVLPVPNKAPPQQENRQQAPPTVLPQVANVQPQGNTMIQDYQKQIESLKAERQLAREEALIYKEQLLKEREIQLQAIMAKMQPAPVPVAQVRPLQPIVVAEPTKSSRCRDPPARAETKDTTTCEESIESSSHRVPTRGSNNEAGNEYFCQPAGEDVFEQSLSSNTKLVTASDCGKSVNDLYKTWRPGEIQQRLASKAAAMKERVRSQELAEEDSKHRVSEAGIQTAEEEVSTRSNCKSQEENEKTSASSDNVRPGAQVPRFSRIPRADNLAVPSAAAEMQESILLSLSLPRNSRRGLRAGLIRGRRERHRRTRVQECTGVHGGRQRAVRVPARSLAPGWTQRTAKSCARGHPPQSDSDCSRNQQTSARTEDDRRVQAAGGGQGPRRASGQTAIFEDVGRSRQDETEALHCVQAAVQVLRSQRGCMIVINVYFCFLAWLCAAGAFIIPVHR